MDNLINKTIHDLTIEDVETAAQENAERYIDRAKNVAHQAFIEGVLWAQKTYKEYRAC